MKKIVILLAAMASATPAVAVMSSGIFYRTTYYSDASLTVVVGEVVQLCDGTSYSNGYPTEHSLYQEYEC